MMPQIQLRTFGTPDIDISGTPAIGDFHQAAAHSHPGHFRHFTYPAPLP